MVVGQIVTIPISGMIQGWGALNRRPDATATAIPKLPDFISGATYRVLTFGDGKYGQYAVVRAGGLLDSEFFPESLYRRSFPNQTAYAKFLVDRKVQFVVVDYRYRKFHTNEQQLLDAMAAAPTGCVAGVTVQEADRSPTLTLYRISRECSPPVPKN